MEEEGEEEEASFPSGPRRGIALTAGDKWRIVKPLLMRYMLPLCKSTPQTSWATANYIAR